jgi:conjugal transfer pilus assembly protein TraK
VFLRPALGIAKAFSFFVRDDAGETYTLLALPVDMPSDTVLLRSGSRTATKGGSSAEIGNRTPPHVQRIKSLMRAMATGVIAEGYLPDYKREPVDLWNEAKVLRTARFQGELIGEIYEVTNVSGTPMQLAEHEFGRLGADVAAVAIERHTLAPKQTTRVYVVQGKGLGDHDGK